MRCWSRTTSRRIDSALHVFNVDSRPISRSSPDPFHPSTVRDGYLATEPGDRAAAGQRLALGARRQATPTPGSTRSDNCPEDPNPELTPTASRSTPTATSSATPATPPRAASSRRRSSVTGPSRSTRPPPAAHSSATRRQRPTTSIPIPPPVCAPAAGSLFAIGTTALACTATDASGNAASASFTVTVLGAKEQLANLIGKVIDSTSLPAAPCDVAGADAGDLDVSFSGDGKQTTDFGGSDAAAAVAVQADGKIVVAGSSGGDFALARYGADGALDPSFSGDGMVTTDLGGTDAGQAVAIQADGRIVVAGSSGGDFALARYSPGGVLDTSRTTDLGAADGGTALAIQADGRIVVSGTSGGNFALARYDAQGVLDTSFSGDGKQTTDFGGLDSSNDVAIRADGAIVVVGTHAFGDGPAGHFAPRTSRWRATARRACFRPRGRLTTATANPPTTAAKAWRSRPTAASRSSDTAPSKVSSVATSRETCSCSAMTPAARLIRRSTTTAGWPPASVMRTRSAMALCSRATAGS